MSDTSSSVFEVGSGNEQDFPAKAINAEQATEDLTENLRRSDLVGHQEIGSAENRTSLSEARAASGKHLGLYRGDDRGNSEPITFDHALFTLLDSGATFLHGGHEKVTQAKEITWVRLAEKTTGVEFIHANLHLVAGAFNGHHPATEALRRSLHATGRANLFALLSPLAKAGVPIVVTGDFNVRANSNEIQIFDKTFEGRRVHRGMGGRSIDHLYFIDGTTASWDVEHFGLDKRHSDHAYRWAKVRLTPTRPTAPVQEDTPVITKKSEAAEVIAWAKKQVGYHEGRDANGNWNNQNKFAAIAGHANGYAWCATFVCAAFKATGNADLLATPSAGCDQLAAGFKTAGRWSEYPAVGAVVFYGKASDLSHTGIVARYDADYIYTVEGNTNTTGSAQGDGVYALKRSRRSTSVVGYGYPAYAGGIESADPAWKNGTKGSTTPTPSAPSSLAYPPKRTLDGVDLSHYQSGTINWARAKTAGVRFVFHKATESTTFRDSLYGRRRREAKKAGIPFGAYHFARPKVGSAAAEAAYFLKYAKPKAGDMRPVLDLETNGGLSTAALTEWVKTWCAAVTKATGVAPIIYTNQALGSVPAGTRLWVARYSNDFLAPNLPSPWKRAVIWQHGDGVYGPVKSVPGIGACDVNALHPDVSLASLRIPAKKKTTKPPTPAEPTAPVENPAGPTTADLRTLLERARTDINKALAALPKG